MKTKITKILTIILCLALSLTFIVACDSDDEPKEAEATTAASTTAETTKAPSGELEKSTMPYIVDATRVFISAITMLPTKLHTAARASAPFGVIERVDMQLEIALGASVQPLTRITDSIRIVKIISIQHLPRRYNLTL